MSRVAASAATHNGLKIPVPFFQCRRCLADNNVTDELKKRGMDSWHGQTSAPLECRCCGEQYTIAYTIP